MKLCSSLWGFCMKDCGIGIVMDKRKYDKYICFQKIPQYWDIQSTLKPCLYLFKWKKSTLRYVYIYCTDICVYILHSLSIFFPCLISLICRTPLALFLRHAMHFCCDMHGLVYCPNNSLSVLTIAC